MGCKAVSTKNDKPRPTETNPNEENKVETIPNENKKEEEPNNNEINTHIKVQSTIEIDNNNDIEHIKISIPLDKNNKWENTYPKGTKIKTIITDFQTQNQFLSSNPDNPQDIILKHNKKGLDLDTSIEAIVQNAFPDNNNNENNKIAILDISYEITNNEHLYSNINKHNDEILKEQFQHETGTLYGIPIQNPFEVFIFSTKTGYFTILTTNQAEIYKINLHKYSRLSSYCNGINCLFISGGENIQTKQILNDFWIIDLHKGSTEQISNTIISKKLHSMIYLPHNKSIYIVGGSSNSTIIYNTTNKSFTNAHNLNIPRIEPALIIINSYLYAFSISNDQGNDISFERTNINSISSWELIKPSISTMNNQLQYQQKLFGVVNNLNNNFLFVGGNIDYENNNNINIKPTCLCYNDKHNTLSYSDNINYNEFDFGEKTFYKYKANKDFIIPSFNRKCPIVILFDKSKQEIKSVPFLTKSKITDPSLLGESRMLSYSCLPKVNSSKYNFNMPKSPRKDNVVNTINEKPITEIVIKEEPEEQEQGEEEKVLNDIHIETEDKIKNDNGDNKKINIGDVYINKDTNKDNLYFNGKLKQIEMKNAGMFFKSSVIKGNQSSIIKQSLLPTVKKSVLPVKSVIRISTNFHQSKINTEEEENYEKVDISGKLNEEIT